MSKVISVPISAVVDEAQRKTRLDSFLCTLPDAPSRSVCVKAIQKGDVLVNGIPVCQKNYMVSPGDVVEFSFIQKPQTPLTIEPNYEIPLDIKFEDEYLLVLSKQAGLVCHPSNAHQNDTLSNALVAHCGLEHLGIAQGVDRPGIVHRLDRDTSGLMVCAKDNNTMLALQSLIQQRRLDRRYIALVQGILSKDEGSITTGIARSTRDRLRMAVSHDPLARTAITTYKTLVRFEPLKSDRGYTLVECHLYTGRTHQIRVHMRHMGHVVVGDPLYGKQGTRLNLDLTRQFLHSWSIRFTHPISQEEVYIQDRLPQDLQSVLKLLQGRSNEMTPTGKAICPLLGVDIVEQE